MAIDKYLNLITSEHRQQPKFIGWLSATLQKIDDGMTMCSSIPSAFDVDNAVGVQLDTVGQSVGQKRDIGVPLTNNSSIFDDDHYRTVIKAKIARNNWDGRIGSVYDIWNNAFPGTTLQMIDNQDMSIQAVVTNLTDNLDTELVTAGLIIPKPMGVTLSIIATTTISSEEYFGTVVSGEDFYTITTQNPA